MPHMLLKRVIYSVVITTMLCLLYGHNVSAKAKLFPYGEITRFGQDIIGLEWSPDGKLIATNSSTSYGIQIWDVSTGTLIKTLKSDGIFGDTDDGTFFLHWSPDGKSIASVIYLHHIFSQYLRQKFFSLKKCRFQSKCELS